MKKRGHTQLWTRNHNNWTHKFPELAKQIDRLPIKNLILDGEVVVLDEYQRSNFQYLQNSINENKDQSFIYYVFDLLYYDQYDLTDSPLLKRKEILALLIENHSDSIRYSDHIVGFGNEIFKKSCELGLEGIVSKLSQSKYQQTRTKDWLKSKCSKRQEFIIGGYTLPQGERKYFGSLFLGTYNDEKELIYHGNVGTGFTDSSLKTLHQQLKKLHTVQMPFNKKPPGSNHAQWVKPKLVAEVEFTEWTEDDKVRHPSFKGLRMDKPPKTIQKEIPSKKAIKITNKKTFIHSSKNTKNLLPISLSHPDKLLYPEDKITKLMLVEYYDRVHDLVLPYITKRPLTLVRCPSNYKHCFYQKHLDESRSNSIYSILIKEKNGDKEEYLYIKDRKGLLYLAQLGVLELHPWGSDINHLEKPDRIIFDLDPSPNLPWKKVVAAAFQLKHLFEDLNLKSFVKTTGGKGLHVVIPIQPQYDWEKIKNFSHEIVNYLVMHHPNDYVSKMTKTLRTGKIFIDYLRNQRGATAVAPYSTRARRSAPISVPLDWNELTSRFQDTFFTLKTITERLNNLKKDPWEDFLKIKQSLTLLRLQRFNRI